MKKNNERTTAKKQKKQAASKERRKRRVKKVNDRVMAKVRGFLVQMDRLNAENRSLKARLDALTPKDPTQDEHPNPA